MFLAGSYHTNTCCMGFPLSLLPGEFGVQIAQKPPCKLHRDQLAYAHAVNCSYGTVRFSSPTEANFASPPQTRKGGRSRSRMGLSSGVSLVLLEFYHAAY